ncbi:transcription factor AFT domain-containing protein [Purpureocillium lilacinum]|uniref:Transcription factor AFT domain-containing protein n=1 Tax=Purpureocillium lilacinum TaxID=33203 RepID=A0A179F3W7_PURLI|nr:transcription factor AFT domain-containing protein [Purpureocillium lilacinum]
MLPPPEGIFQTFEELMISVQQVAESQGYSVIKLRTSNYRDGKPTRYDLACDRGGARHGTTSTGPKRSSRKINCPFRVKAVCELRLGKKWRLVLQEARHNHEARMPTHALSYRDAPLSKSVFVSCLITELEAQLDEQRIQVFCDNQQTIKLVNKDINKLQTKLGHVNIHNHWLRQELQRNKIMMEYKPTADMAADGVTKAIGSPGFRRFVQQIGLTVSFEQLSQWRLHE